MKLNNLADTEYVGRVQRGDTGAFRHLVEKYHPMVFTLALRLIGDRQQAEDAAQEVFLKCYRGLAGFQMQSTFSTWLYRIAYNHSLDLLKRKNRKKFATLEEYADVPAAGGSPQDQVDQKDVQSVVHAAIDHLPPADQFLVKLFYYEELPVRDIGRIMDITETNVKVRLFRIRSRLAELLKSKEIINSIVNL